MGLSFGEIFVVFVIGMLFFKPSEIKMFLQKVFSFKKSVEGDIEKLANEVETVEFFEVEKPCQKQQ